MVPNREQFDLNKDVIIAKIQARNCSALRDYIKARLVLNWHENSSACLSNQNLHGFFFSKIAIEKVDQVVNERK